MCRSVNDISKLCGVCVNLRTLWKRHLRSVHCKQRQRVTVLLEDVTHKSYNCHLCQRNFKKLSLRNEHVVIAHSQQTHPSKRSSTKQVVRRNTTVRAGRRSSHVRKRKGRDDVVGRRGRVRALVGSKRKGRKRRDSLDDFIVTSSGSDTISDACDDEVADAVSTPVLTEITGIKAEPHDLDTDKAPTSAKLCSKTQTTSNLSSTTRTTGELSSKAADFCQSLGLQDDGKPLFQCTSCDLTSNSQAEIKRHFDILHSRFQCPHCINTYKFWKGLQKHCTREHPKDQLPSKSKYLRQPRRSRDSAKDDDVKKMSSATAHARVTDSSKQHTDPAQPTSTGSKWSDAGMTRLEKRVASSRVPMVFYQTQAAGADGRVQYKCIECDHVSPNKGNIKRHYSVVHLCEKRFQCPRCSKAYSSKYNLDMHVIRCHKGDVTLPGAGDASVKVEAGKTVYHVELGVDADGVPRFQCSRCAFESRDVEEVRQHHEAAHADSVACLLGNAVYKSHSELQAHLETAGSSCKASSDKRISASAIPQRLPLYAHKRTRNERVEYCSRRHDDGRFACTHPGCDFKSKFRPNVKRHYDKAHLEYDLVCHFCRRKFAWAYELREHALVHAASWIADGGTKEHIKSAPDDSQMNAGVPSDPASDSTPSSGCYDCYYCEKTFEDLQSLSVHFDEHIQQNSHLCDICAKTFLTKKQLGDHMRRHTYSISCDICNKRYSSNNSLRLHQMTHTGEKPNSCEYCGRSFTSRCNLKSHIRSHLGEKPFKCKLCDYRAVQSTSIKKHMIASHSDVRAFSCHLCNKKFKFKSQLTMHVRRHMGDKRHVCEVCNMAFVDTSTLKEHRVTHTDERPHICEICAQTFRRRDKLNLHLRTSHAIDTRKISGYVGLSKDRLKPVPLEKLLPVTAATNATNATTVAAASIGTHATSSTSVVTTSITHHVTPSSNNVHNAANMAVSPGTTDVHATSDVSLTTAQPQYVMTAMSAMHMPPGMNVYPGQVSSDGYNQLVHWPFMTPHQLQPQ